MTDQSVVVSRGRNVASRTGGKKISRGELTEEAWAWVELLLPEAGAVGAGASTALAQKLT